MRIFKVYSDSFNACPSFEFEQYAVPSSPSRASNWTLIVGNSSGFPGNTSTELQSPTDVTLDPMGNIYVSDFNNHRIQFFLRDQSIGKTIVGITSISDNSSTVLNRPISLKLDNQLNLYVVDYINNRIQKFLRY